MNATSVLVCALLALASLAWGVRGRPFEPARRRYRWVSELLQGRAARAPRALMLAAAASLGAGAAADGHAGIGAARLAAAAGLAVTTLADYKRAPTLHVVAANAFFVFACVFAGATALQCPTAPSLVGLGALLAELGALSVALSRALRERPAGVRALAGYRSLMVDDTSGGPLDEARRAEWGAVLAFVAFGVLRAL